MALKGQRFEQQVVRDLRDEGFICARSAASKSPVDVWAIHPERRIIYLIQCKKVNHDITDAEKKRIMKELEGCSGMFEVRSELFEG